MRLQGCWRFVAKDIVKSILIFPAAFMANSFTLTLVLIGLSLFGKPGLAADFGIVHGATVALFMRFLETLGA